MAQHYIKQIMAQKGVTVSDLASRMKNRAGGIGVSQSAVSQLLAGNPSLDKIVEIAEILDVPAGRLLSPDAGNQFTCPHCGRSFSLNPTPLDGQE